MVDITKAFEGNPGAAVTYNVTGDPSPAVAATPKKRSPRKQKKKGRPAQAEDIADGLEEAASYLEEMKAAGVTGIFTDFPKNFQIPVRAYTEGRITEDALESQLSQLEGGMRNAMQRYSAPELINMRRLFTPLPAEPMMDFLKAAKENGMKVALLGDPIEESMQKFGKEFTQAREQAQKKARPGEVPALGAIVQDVLDNGVERDAREWSRIVNRYADDHPTEKYLVVARREYMEPRAGIDGAMLSSLLGNRQEDKPAQRKGIPVLVLGAAARGIALKADVDHDGIIEPDEMESAVAVAKQLEKMGVTAEKNIPSFSDPPMAPPLAPNMAPKRKNQPAGRPGGFGGGGPF